MKDVLDGVGEAFGFAPPLALGRASRLLGALDGVRVRVADELVEVDRLLGGNSIRYCPKDNKIFGPESQT